MHKAIKKIAEPYFRGIGFKGRFPHFRKIESDKIKLLTFQFNLAGGSFVVELAQCDAKPLITNWGEEISPAKITAHDLNNRYRLGSLEQSGFWFVFGKPERGSIASRICAAMRRMFQSPRTLP